MLCILILTGIERRRRQFIHLHLDLYISNLNYIKLVTMVVVHRLTAETISANIPCDFITNTYYRYPNTLNFIYFKLNID